MILPDLGTDGATDVAKPRILAFTPYYAPAKKAGGAPISLARMIERLSDEFDFHVVTSERDVGDDRPLEGIVPGEWNPVGPAMVRYLAPHEAGPAGIRSLMRGRRPDAIFLNSLFARAYSMFPLLVTRLTGKDDPLRACPLVVAPQGELGYGALDHKSGRKALYLRTVRALRLYTHVYWRAATPDEAERIREHFPHGIVHVVPDIPPKLPDRLLDELTHGERQREKATGTLRLVFLARISRHKNLIGALLALKRLRGRIQFTIYGPIEEPDYWSECQRAIRELPPDIHVEYGGVLANEDVIPALREHDVYVLPSHGENYGYSIVEALAAGRPVAISDRTPWRGLKQLGVGYDVPLDDDEALARAIQTFVDMDAERFLAWSKSAQRLGLEHCRGAEAEATARAFFRNILRGT